MIDDRILYSCVVDGEPRFVFQAWGLVCSLRELAGVRPDHIYLHYTESVHPAFLEEFRGLGVQTRPIGRFGDGKYCNKIAQLETAELRDAAGVFLLDADMVVLEPIAGLLDPDAISGKVVDLPNPDVGTLREIFDRAGFGSYPALCLTDFDRSETFRGNLNGGLYAIPGRFAASLSERWRHWALWLLEHPEPLEGVDKLQHVDQVSFAMAVHELSMPVKLVDRRFNCPIHQEAQIEGYPAVIHYHDKISKVGRLEPLAQGDAEFARAIAGANRLLGSCLNNRIFWSYRYQRFPELGSGVGSRGENLAYKRNLLMRLGVEKSRSVLDVGCGDLEVLRDFRFNAYTGIDVSPEAVRIAQSKRPDLSFVLADPENDALIPDADTVLCFEVLIHQESAEDYYRLIDLLARKTQRRLIVSGYSARYSGHDENLMIRFYEPLVDSLRRTGRFSRIEVVGRHTDVEIVLATVAGNTAAAPNGTLLGRLLEWLRALRG